MNVNPTGGIRQLVGKLFGRDGVDRGDPFADTTSSPLATTQIHVDEETIARFEEAIGYRINNQHFFIEALTHRSYLQLIEEGTAGSNERLEFLGDSILNMLIGEFLFRHYREVQEGELTKLRSRLVNKKALILGAHKIRLHDFVLLNTSAEQSLKQGNLAILADAFEAVIAAIYLDSRLRLQPVKEFLTRTILSPDVFEQILAIDENFKSALLEMAQGSGYEAPRYVVISEEGPDHERLFTVEVFVDNESLGEGQGRSKKKAEQEAARMAIERLNAKIQGLNGNGAELKELHNGKEQKDSEDV